MLISSDTSWFPWGGRKQANVILSLFCRTQRFSTLALSTLWPDMHSPAGWWAELLVHCGTFSIISSFCPPDSSASSPSCENRKCHHTFPDMSRGWAAAPVENHWSNRIEQSSLRLFFLSTVSPPTTDPCDRSAGLCTHGSYLWLPLHPSDLYQPRFLSAVLFTRRAIKSNLIGPTQLDVIKSS